MYRSEGQTMVPPEGGMMSRSFWEQRAQDYPSPFKETSLARTQRVLRLMQRRGIPLQGVHVLDVGSGPGTFALPLALGGASVTALDISAGMLARVDAEAKRLGIPRVKTLQGSWKEIHAEKARLAGAFDLVVSALSIAIETEEDLLKMEQCSKHWCVCVAAGRLRCGDLYAEILRAFDLPLVHRPDIHRIQGMLEEMGRSFSYDSFPFVHSETKGVGELALDIAKSLAAQGREMDPEEIGSIIQSVLGRSRMEPPVDCSRYSSKGVIIWNTGQEPHEP